MTLEQAIQRILDKESQISQLQSEIRLAKQNLKNLTPYKIGDKVLVVAGTKSMEVYIQGVEWSTHRARGQNLKYAYLFSKPKKDGSMGHQSAGIYGYDSVTLITKGNGHSI